MASKLVFCCCFFSKLILHLKYILFYCNVALNVLHCYIVGLLLQINVVLFNILFIKNQNSTLISQETSKYDVKSYFTFYSNRKVIKIVIIFHNNTVFTVFLTT